MGFLLPIFLFIFAVFTLYIFTRISTEQNDPYMDEIFHIPQAHNYCNGNFTHWDPMITTPPGLYLVSVGLYRPLAAVLHVPMAQLCTSVWLRATNLVFTFGNFYLVYALLQQLHNPLLDQEGIKLGMTTLALSTFPLLHFFTHLYYTDTGSSFFVLLMYLFNLHNSHFMSALMGVVSLMFRQTNIVWVIFSAGLVVRKELGKWMGEELSKKEKKVTDMSDIEVLTFTVKNIWQGILKRRQSFRKFVISVLKSVWMYILVGLGFAVFVVVNNGIVLGDRSQHSVAFNIPQLFYFLSFTNFFAFFHVFSPTKVLDFLKFCTRKWLVALLFMTLSAAAIHFFTYEHKYLLADNRHYTFYIWSKIYRRHNYVKFALIPAYFYFVWNFFMALKDRDIFWRIIYCLVVVITTVPQKLLEFRYFILPYLIFRMNMRYGTAFGLLHEILLYAAVNVATVYLFVEKPFKWSHEAGVQRFIW